MFLIWHWLAAKSAIRRIGSRHVAGDRHALFHVCPVSAQRAEGDAQRSGGDGRGEHDAEHHGVERIPGAALFGVHAFQHLSGFAHSILGHEHRVHPDVLAAGALETHDVPAVVDDLVVTPRQHEVTHVTSSRYRSAVGRGDGAAENHPPTEVGPGRVRPFAGEQKPTIDRLGATERCIGRGSPGVGVVAVDLLLELRVHEGDLPRMDPDDAGDPARRWLVNAGGDDPVDELVGVLLEAPEILGQEQAKSA
jgi:hypothetical protein